MLTIAKRFEAKLCCPSTTLTHSRPRLTVNCLPKLWYVVSFCLCRSRTGFDPVHLSHKCDTHVVLAIPVWHIRQADLLVKTLRHVEKDLTKAAKVALPALLCCLESVYDCHSLSGSTLLTLEGDMDTGPEGNQDEDEISDSTSMVPAFAALAEASSSLAMVKNEDGDLVSLDQHRRSRLLREIVQRGENGILSAATAAKILAGRRPHRSSPRKRRINGLPSPPPLPKGLARPRSFPTISTSVFVASSDTIGASAQTNRPSTARVPVVSRAGSTTGAPSFPVLSGNSQRRQRSASASPTRNRRHRHREGDGRHTQRLPSPKAARSRRGASGGSRGRSDSPRRRQRGNLFSANVGAVGSSSNNNDNDNDDDNDDLDEHHNRDIRANRHHHHHHNEPRVDHQTQPATDNDLGEQGARTLPSLNNGASADVGAVNGRGSKPSSPIRKSLAILTASTSTAGRSEFRRTYEQHQTRPATTSSPTSTSTSASTSPRRVMIRPTTANNSSSADLLQNISNSTPASASASARLVRRKFDTCEPFFDLVRLEAEQNAKVEWTRPAYKKKLLAIRRARLMQQQGQDMLERMRSGRPQPVKLLCRLTAEEELPSNSFL